MAPVTLTLWPLCSFIVFSLSLTPRHRFFSSSFLFGMEDFPVSSAVPAPLLGSAVYLGALFGLSWGTSTPILPPPSDFHLAFPLFSPLKCSNKKQGPKGGLGPGRSPVSGSGLGHALILPTEPEMTPAMGRHCACGLVRNLQVRGSWQIVSRLLAKRSCKMVR